MAVKLIALDIDGTLLSSKQEILPSTKRAVTEALNAGIKIVLCTGRPLAGVSHFLKELGVAGDDQYVVTYNGAVTETVSGHVVAKHLLDRTAYEKLTAFGQAHQVPFNVLDENSEIYTADRDLHFLEVVQAMENSAGLKIRTPEEMPADFEIAKGVFVGSEELLDATEPALRVEFEPQYSVVRASRWFLEVMAAGVNKGQALRDLAKVLDLDPAEMMAVGDEGNDLAMFAAVGVSVAMGNGSDEAKAGAKYVTARNDDDGLAMAIDKYALGK